MEVTGGNQTSAAHGAPLLPDAHCTPEMALPWIQQRSFAALLLISQLSRVVSAMYCVPQFRELAYKPTFSLPARQLHNSPP